MDPSRLITVVLTTYNRCNLLPRAVRSVLSGSYKNCELLIIDDASTDKTSEVIEGLKDERIKYIRMETNGGALRARNRGFDLARGDYITILDDDDELVPNALETVASEFGKANNEGVDILWFDCVDAEVGKISGVMPSGGGLIKFDEYVCGKIDGDFWLAFSKKALMKNRFREDLKANESLLWLKMHKEFSASYVPTILCRKFRQHGGERLSHLDVRLRQLPETTLAFRLYLTEFGEDMRRACPGTYGYRLATLGLYELMVGDYLSGRRSILESLRFRFSLKYLVLYILSWFVGPKKIIALFRRTERLSATN